MVFISLIAYVFGAINEKTDGSILPVSLSALANTVVGLLFAFPYLDKYRRKLSWMN
ncbi:MAG: hypothetical protein ACLU93_06400 [Streptococcus sp.]